MFSRPWWLLAVALVGCDTDIVPGGGAPEVVAGTFGTGSSQRDPDTLIVGRASDAIYLDPARPTDNESVEVIEQIYEGLLTYQPGSNTIEPGLAISWAPSDRGTSWTFQLRRGVRFHDGTPFNADAVVFSLERQRDPYHPFHKEGWFNYWENVYKNVIKVEKTGEYEVRIDIERPYAPFLANMAMFPVGIVSPTAVEKYGDDFYRHPVGTGPWRFSAWEKGGRIVLERNDDYWGEESNLRRLVFQVISDPRQRLIALESGAIDIAHSIMPEELQFVELHPDLTLHATPANNVAYMAMNTTHPPFDDRRVRRAANYAVNKEPIVKLVYQGRASPADGPLPPTQWGYHPVGETATYEYDPEKARELLAEAEAEGRFDPEQTHTLYVPSDPRPYLPDPERVGRVLAANLRDIGIKVELVVNPFKTHIETVQRGEHDMCVLGWVGDNGDPDNFLYILFDRDNTVPGLARNLAFWRDPELHGLLVMAQESDDRSEREALYARVQELIAREAPWVPIAHSQVSVATHDDVGNILLNPSGHVDYAGVKRRRR